MKHFISLATIVLVLAGFSISVQAQTNAASTDATASSAADRDKATLEKHTKPVLDALNLAGADDADKEVKVREVMAEYFTALKTWHATNDGQIKELWDDFDKSRAKGATNVTANANAALDKLADVYATFKPQHEKFLADLGTVLTPSQIETVKDALTINKVKVTYNVYLQIFPTLTDAQKAVVLQDLKDAREEAIDCEQMKEKSAFFKKYKIKIEDEYLTAQGYDPQQARKDFAAKAKAAKAAKADDKE